MVDTINASNNSDVIYQQMATHRDLHLKEIIDLKQAHMTVVNKLENEISLLNKDKDELNDKVESLESQILTKQKEVDSFKNQEALTVKEYELKINMLKYKFEREREIMDAKIRQIQNDCTSPKNNDELNTMKANLQFELKKVKQAHEVEKLALEKHINKLNAKIQDLIHGVHITSGTNATMSEHNEKVNTELQKTLEIIHSEEGSEYQDDSIEEVININDLQDKCEFNTIKIFEENEKLKRFVQDLESNVIKNKDTIIKQLETELENKDQIISKLKEELMDRAKLEVQEIKLQSHMKDSSFSDQNIHP